MLNENANTAMMMILRKVFIMFYSVSIIYEPSTKIRACLFRGTVKM
jgi:hypothetical protein